MRQDHSFHAEVIKLKLKQSVTPCEKLCQFVKKEVGKHAEPGDALCQVVLAALHTTQELASRGGSDEVNASAKLAELADGVLRSTEQAMDPSQPSCAPDLDRHRKQELAETMMKCTLRNFQRGSSVSGKVMHVLFGPLKALALQFPQCLNVRTADKSREMVRAHSDEL